jgi:predicted porin
MVNGSLVTSRIGISSSEKLAGGQEIKVKLEGTLLPSSGTVGNTGSTGTVLFDRNAWVGISDSKLGEVQIGRNTVATLDLVGSGIADIFKSQNDPAGQPANTANSTYAVSPLRASQSNTFAGSSSGIKNTRSDGMIKYINNFGPVGITAGYAPGGVNGNNSKSSYSAGVTYVQGPVEVGAAKFTAIDAADKKLQVETVGAKVDVTNKITLQTAQWRLNSDAGYVAANLTTNGTYTGPVLGTAATTGPGTDSKLNVFGASYKVSPVLTATVAAYRGTYNNTAGKTGKLNSEMALAEYVLSKRTSVYAFLDRAKPEGDIASTTVTRPIVGYTVGAKHSF